MKIAKKAVIICAAVTIVLCAATTAGAAIKGPEEATVEIVNTNTGKILTLKGCQVLTDEYNKIRIRSSGGTVIYKMEQIGVIIPTGANGKKLGDGIKAYRNNDFTAAISHLQGAQRLYKKEYADIYATYYLGLCYIYRGRGGDLKTGLNLLKKFTSESKWSKSRFVPWALLHSARIHRATGKTAAAMSAYNTLFKGNYGHAWRLEGNLGRGEILLQKGKAHEAKAIFRRVQLDARRNKKLFIRAKMNQGKCHVALNELEKAENLFKGILNKSDKENLEKEVMAGAYNGLGDCYYAEVKSRESRKKALLQYLRVITVYSTIRSEYANALKQAAKCFDYLGQKKRAEELRTEFRDRFPRGK